MQCALISQLKPVTKSGQLVSTEQTPPTPSEWWCLMPVSRMDVPQLIADQFMHLRLTTNKDTGEVCVPFTDICRSFGMGNNGWNLKLSYRL